MSTELLIIIILLALLLSFVLFVFIFSFFSTKKMQDHYARLLNHQDSVINSLLGNKIPVETKFMTTEVKSRVRDDRIADRSDNPSVFEISGSKDNEQN